MRFIIDRQLFPKTPTDTTYRIFRCHSADGGLFNSFSLKGNLPHLFVGSEYNAELILVEENKWGQTYELAEKIDVDISHLTEEDSRNILLAVTTKQQTDYIMRDFPQFVQYVLDGKVDEIPIKNIYNVGEYKCQLYAQLIINNYKLISIQNTLREYNLSIEECRSLNVEYQDINLMSTAIKQHPYIVFVEVLKRSFEAVDDFICIKFPEMRHSKERCEFAVLNVLNDVELSGSTRINANQCVKYIPRELFDIVVETVNGSERIYFDKTTKYMSKMSTYRKEVSIAEKLISLINNSSNLGLDVEKYINTLQEYKPTEEQLQILDIVNRNNVCLLMGSAGTGKSFTTKAIVDMCVSNGISVRLLAPTGIASKVLSQATEQDATTIHSAVFNCCCDFPEDVIIVDEFSMVSIDVMSMICEKLNEAHRLIMVCDAAQLPSIGCGNVLTDIVNSSIIPNVTLTKVFRFGTSGIATTTTNIRNGIEYLTNNGELQFQCVEQDYRFLPIGSNPLKQIDDIYSELLTKYDKKDIMILSPFNKGDFGTKKINEMIQSKYNPSDFEVGYKSIKFHVGDMVINIHNNYNAMSKEKFEYDKWILEEDKAGNLDDDFVPQTFDRTAVMNGDIGIITDIDANKNIFVQFDNIEIVYAPNEYHNLLLAYAISIHKSQGSQAKAVVVITHPQHIKMLNRNLLYVATTRAQKELVEIGSASTINEAIKIEETRMRDTWLRHLLKIT